MRTVIVLMVRVQVGFVMMAVESVDHNVLFPVETG